MGKVNIQDISEDKELKALILLRSIYKEKLNWIESELNNLQGEK